MKINKQMTLDKLLEGIHKYTEIINEHKGAVLERENLDSLVQAYAVINDDNESNEQFKQTLKETFGL
ncbi:hypothetical protein [Salinicoccus halodurans]|uniref:Uncharacterized protein n=1 Tax=Salinicoccus halodurans TaxID=407035 RepID=A0A0F7HMI9_9STAP|nr:hypothetical protein [Salinicoccus halodurans]AKG74361.1 hypothetical protein AAT16_09015 [Salinicoccus halodurans]SFK94970.1 hypothetical protein SAMN05216235_2700 [Salinicoccus halodurans]